VHFRLVCLFLAGSLLGVIEAQGPAIQHAPAATPSLFVVASTPIPQVAILKQPVKVKILYGETVIPAGTRLPVVSIDLTTVRVNYMGDVQTIPITAAQFESAPATAVVPPKPNAPQPPAAATPQITVALSPGWDTRMQGGDITASELQSLLSQYCTAAVDLSGYGIDIYNGVRYLMEANEAANILRVSHSLPSRVRLATPGFPRQGMYYDAYDGSFEGHFNRLYLVTDAANRVVALQFVDEHPRGWESLSPFDQQNWSTYNFINSRTRSSDLVRIDDESKRHGDVIEITTRMFEPERLRRRVASRYRELENTKLLIPVPFARIILHCAQIGLSK
jgi:hypothetical protein